MENKNYFWRPVSEYTGGRVLATNGLDVLIGEINSEGDCESEEDSGIVLCGITRFIKIEEILPELKESRDEKIRKKLLSSFKGIMADADEDELWNGLPYNDIIAWLEKQGQHDKFINNIQIGDQVTRNQDGMLVNLSQLKRVAKPSEKQGKQKSANKEYTFKVIPRLLGMIQPTDRAKSYCQKLIDSLEQEGYSTDAKIVRDCLKQMNGEKVAMATMDEQKSAWSEEDEKMINACTEFIGSTICPNYGEEDGVTTDSCRKWLKSLKDRVQPQQEWSEEDENLFRCAIDAVEQESKVRTDGCLDEEVGKMVTDWLKSLKGRVQPKKQEWKQENTDDLTDFENAMMHIGDSFFGQHAGLDPNDTNAIKEQANTLLGLVPSKEWSEEDKNMLQSILDEYKSMPIEKRNWLKSLKGRVQPQPKQEWSEEDESMFELILFYLDRYVKMKDVSKCETWLKSIKDRVQPQSQWKPSEEQIQALEWQVANTNESSWQGKASKELLEQLKQL